MIVEWPDVYILKLTLRTPALAFALAQRLKIRKEMFGFRFLPTGPCDNVMLDGKSVFVKVSNSDGDQKMIQDCAKLLELTSILVIRTWHFEVAKRNKKPGRVERQFKNLDWVSIA